MVNKQATDLSLKNVEPLGSLIIPVFLIKIVHYKEQTCICLLSYQEEVELLAVEEEAASLKNPVIPFLLEIYHLIQLRSHLRKFSKEVKK